MAKNKTTSITVKANLDTTDFDNKIKSLESTIARTQSKLQRLSKSNISDILNASATGNASSIVSASSSRLDTSSERIKARIESETIKKIKRIDEEYAKKLSALREHSGFTGTGKEVEKQIKTQELKLLKERNKSHDLLQRRNLEAIALTNKSVEYRKDAVKKEATNLISMSGSLRTTEGNRDASRFAGPAKPTFQSALATQSSISTDFSSIAALQQAAINKAYSDKQAARVAQAAQAQAAQSAALARNNAIIDANAKRAADRAAARAQVIQTTNATNTARNAVTSNARSRVVSGINSGASAGSALALGYLGGNLIEQVGIYKQLEARVRNVSISSEEAARSMSNLTGIARASGQSLRSTADMFSKITDAVRSNNGTTEDATAVVNAFQNSLRASGTTADQASASAYQLSQALSSGVLRGDEFTSVNEGSPLFTRAMADSMGVTVGGLKELAQSGALTTTRVVEASKAALPRILEQSANVPLTVSATAGQTVDKIVAEFNEMDKKYDIIKKLSSAIQMVGDNASAVIPIMAVLGGIVGLGVLGKAVSFIKEGAAVIGLASRAMAPVIASGAVGSAGAVAAGAAGATGARVVAGSAIGTAAGAAIARVLPLVLKAKGLIFNPYVFAATLAYGGYSYMQNNREEARNKRKVTDKDLSDNSNSYEANLKTGSTIDRVKSKETYRKSLESRIKEEDFLFAVGKSKTNKSLKDYEALKLNRETSEKLTYKLEALNSDETEAKTKGAYLGARGSAGIEEAKAVGGSILGEKAFKSITGLPILLKEFDDKAFLAKGELELTLGDISVAIGTFVENLKTDSDIGAGLIVLMKQRATESGAIASLLDNAISKLNVKQEEAINTRIESSLYAFNKRIESLDTIRKSTDASSKATSLSSLSLSNTDKELDLYKSGLPSESNAANYYKEVANIEISANKKVLKDSLEQVETIRKAKLKSQSIDLDVKLKAISDEDKKRYKKYTDTVAKDSSPAVREAIIDELQDPVYAASLKVETQAKTIAARKGLEQEAAVAIQQIDLAAMRERQALLTQYVTDVDTSIKTTLESYQRYSKQLVDIDRDSTQKRMDLRKSLRALDLDKKISEDNLEYAKKKSLIRKNSGDTLDPRFKSNIAIDFAKKEQDSLLQQISLTDDLVEKQRLLNAYREESQTLLSTRESSIGATSNSDIEKQKAVIAAKDSYAKELQKAFDLQSEIDSTQRSDIEGALGTTKSVLDASVTDRGSKSKELSGLNQSLLGSAQADFNKVNVVASKESIESLKKSIQDSLDASTFMIGLQESTYKSYSLNEKKDVATSTVNIYLPGGDKLEAQMTQQQVSEAKTLTNITNRT